MLTKLEDLRGQLRTWLDFYTDEPTLLAAILISSALGIGAIAIGLHVIGIASAALLPWIPILVRKIRGDWAHYGYLALFELVVVLQLAHFAEHLSQMIELHFLNWSPALAKGIIGELDIEPVHFWWNIIILAAATLLLFRYRTNYWLWASWLFSIWHQIEHTYIYFVWYLPKNISGHPGILGAGGLVDQTNIYIPLLTELGRADLHFWYNLFEIGLFVTAFIAQTIAWRRALAPQAATFAPMSWRRRLVIAGSLLQIPLILGFALMRTSPATLRVPDNYPTIQAAIDAAPDWSIIRIGPGTYNEALVIDKPLTLLGAPNNATRLMESPDATGITIRKTHDVILKQLAVEGGTYGILVDNSVAVQILNNRVANASYVGIRLSTASANIIGNQVVSVNGPYGVGIELANTVSKPPSLIQNNLITGNTLEGIVMHNAMAMIDHNTITGNGFRGIAVTEMSMATVRDNTLTANSDAGIYVVDSSMAEILSNRVSDVRPGPLGYAYGIHAYYNAEVKLGDNTITMDPKDAVVAGGDATIQKDGAP